MAIRGVTSLSDIIAEAREMQISGQYINGTIFHAMADRIEDLEKGLEACTRRDIMNCLELSDVQRNAIRAKLLYDI